MRTFVAIRVVPLPQSQRSSESKGGSTNVDGALTAAVSTLTSIGAAVKPVSMRDLHITLKFLGTTEAAMIPNAVEILGTVARRHKPFHFEVAGSGAFPDATSPRVVWAGVQPEDPFRQIAGDLSEDFQGLGFGPESRPYQPHITLCRVKQPNPRIGRWLQSHSTSQFATCRASSLDLMRSELTPIGARYSVVESVPLSANGSEFAWPADSRE